MGNRSLPSYAAPFAALLAGLAALIGGCDSERRAAHTERHAARPAAPRRGVEDLDLAVRIYFRPLPDAMPGAGDDTPALVALGRKLYFERGISLTKSQSCNDCHRLDDGGSGADGLSTSKGARGTFGTRNSPTVLNAGLQAMQFWDGRSADLFEQAKGPVLNPVEMAMTTPEDVAARLKSSDEYRRGFAAAYPKEAEPVTFDNMARAIAAFERTLLTPSRFDRYLKGDLGALTPEEERGLHRFADTGCTMCHSGIPVGGRLYQRFGVHHPYASQTDTGRHQVTGKEEDKHVFKVPMLRNVTRTAPYFHDGKVKELREAVRLMAWMQLDTALKPAEIAEIVRFLGALEGERPLHIAAP